jgi:hypothetical protein
MIERTICGALLFFSGPYLLALWVIAFIVDAVVSATYSVVVTVRGYCGAALQREPRIVVMVRGVRDWPWSCTKYLCEANLGLPHNVRYHYLDQKIY